MIATAGLHGSGSTWVFNIVRELVIAAVGEAAICGAYADALEELPERNTLADRWLVVKSHHGSVAMDAWLRDEGASHVLSIRDPRDAALSIHQRFGVPLVWAVQMVMNDCRRLCRLIAEGRTALRYEDRFFEQPETIHAIAAALGLRVDAGLAETLSRSYSAAATRSFIETLPSLPPARLAGAETQLFDTVTQIHLNHIGDTSSGKWTALAPAIQRQMTHMLGPFLEALDYPR